jgi:hypothetical protein
MNGLEDGDTTAQFRIRSELLERNRENRKKAKRGFSTKQALDFFHSLFTSRQCISLKMPPSDRRKKKD